MRSFFGLCILFCFLSCSLKDAADNDFKPQSKITPIAPAETLAKKYGDGNEAVFTIKVPLTEDSIGYFDIDEIIGSRDLDSKRKHFIERVYDSFKLTFFNLAIGLGFSNIIKYSTSFEFPEIDPKYIKSARVKKVFFTTEDCREGEGNCNDLSKIQSNFNFIEKFYLNIRANNELENTDEIKVLSKSQLKKFEKKIDINDSVERELKNDSTVINIVSFKNRVPALDLDIGNIPDDTRYLYFSTKKNKGAIAKYFRNEKFSEFIKGVRVYNAKYKEQFEGIEVVLKRKVNAQKILEVISEDQSKAALSMLIFRMNSNPMEAKKYFKQEIFKRYIQDISVIGRSVFVQFRDAKTRKYFSKMIETFKINDRLDIYKVDSCSRANCIDFEVEETNLVPLLSKNPKVIIDTVLKIRSISLEDFKYNGFVEIEVKLNLPI